MLKKILGVVLIVLGAGLAFAFFTSTADETQDAHFNKAVYVQDALIHAENEGKVIIVPGKPALLKKLPILNSGFPWKHLCWYVQ